MARVLIVDDDAAFRESLAETLDSIGHVTLGAPSGREALACLAHGGIDAVFLDFRLPDLSGLEILRNLRTVPLASRVPIVMLTAYASADNTIEAIKLGAFDHLSKPVSREAIERTLAAALRSQSTPAAAREPGKEHDFIVHSEGMRDVVKLIGRAAASDATVLITGETGSGKEEVARALHRYSARAAKPFVAINCAAIPRDLLESELFGHVRGAFTGALATRAGLFQQADGGSLLLDEIGDMSADLQAKLLRVLQEGAVQPVGADRSVRVNVRVLAATHRTLERLVAEGGFRQDLFYRLNVLQIRIPPLRERRTDVIPLAEHFLAQASDPPKALSEDARSALLAYSWPGNVREIRNVVERASILARGSRIEASDLGFDEPTSLQPEASTLPMALSRLEETMIRKAIVEAAGNRAEAARRLGIRRQLLYAKLRQYGIGS
jgi:two-component system NtrC family response regulator